MKKLIAIDLDGTLLTPTLEISTENIVAINKALDAGHIVMICSGRAPEDINNVLKSVDIVCPIAGSNGTVVVIDGTIKSEISMNKQDVSKIAEILTLKTNPYKIYTSNGIYVPSSWNVNFEKTLAEFPEIREALTEKELRLISEQPKESDSIRHFQTIEDILTDEELTIQKFFIPTMVPQIKEDLFNTLQQEVKNITITTSGPFNIEIMDSNGNKSNGLKTVAEHYQIPLENTIAIGDNFNDVPMMEAAGLSIAMGNADPQVKELCDVTTLSNVENGVAEAIKKFMLV